MTAAPADGPSSRNARRFRADLVRCLAWAAISLVVAFPAMRLAGIPLATAGMRWLVLPPAAITAAVLAALAVHLLRPLRQRALGWALTGAGIGLGIGAPLGVALAVLYDPLGVWLLGVPRHAALGFVPQALVAVLLVGSGIGGYVGFRERTDASVF